MRSSLIAALFLCLATLAAKAQKVLDEKIADIRSQNVERVDLDEAKGQITMVFRTKQKGKSIEMLQNTYALSDLSLIESKPFTIDRSELTKRGYASGFLGGDGIVRFLRADNNATGQFSLKRGYLELRRFGRSWITDFKTEEKVKPKGITGNKLTMLLYVTDYPRFTNPFGAGFQGANNMTLGTGNITVFMYEKEAPYYTKYQVGRWSAKTLEKIDSRPITLDKPYFPISTQQLENNDMGLIFASVASGASLLYLRLSKEGKELERVEIPLEVAGNHNLRVTQDELGTHINGLTDAEAKVQIVGVNEVTTVAGLANKFDGNRMNYTKPSHLTFITIKDGKVTYSNQTKIGQHLSTAVSMPESKLKLPTADKAEKEFKWNKMGYGTFFSASDGNKTFLLGQDYNKMLHFVAQYDQKSGLEKTYFLPRELPTAPNQLFHINNGKLYWFVGEEDVEKGKSKTSFVAIDAASGSMKEWYKLDDKFYPSPVSFLNFYEGGSKAIMIELNEKGKGVKLTKAQF